MSFPTGVVLSAQTDRDSNTHQVLQGFKQAAKTATVATAVKQRQQQKEHQQQTTAAAGATAALASLTPTKGEAASATDLGSG